MRELEAEAVAYVVGSAVGLNTADASRDYIHLYRGDRDALASSLERVQRAASLMLTVIGFASTDPQKCSLLGRQLRQS